MYSYGPPHIAEQKQDDQLEHTYSSSVRIRYVALKTCQRRWTIGKSGERGSGISVLVERHDDDDDDIPDIGIIVRVFANGPGDLGSILGRVIPKSQKMVLDATLLNTQHYKVKIKGKVKQSREWSSALPLQLSVVAIEKGAFRSPSTTVANFTLHTSVLNLKDSKWSPSSWWGREVQRAKSKNEEIVIFYLL